MNTTNILYRDFRDTNHLTIAEILKKADLSYLPDVLLYHLCIQRVMWIAEDSKEEKMQWGLFFDSIYFSIWIDNQCVGIVSLEQPDKYAPEGTPAELGVIILPDYYNMGIATAATKYICNYAFENNLFNKINATTFEKNTAMRHILEKLGFHYDGIKRNSVIKNNVIHSECFYSLDNT